MGCDLGGFRPIPVEEGGFVLGRLCPGVMSGHPFCRIGPFCSESMQAAALAGLIIISR